VSDTVADPAVLVAAARADERAKVCAEHYAELCRECREGQGVHVGEDDVWYHGEGLNCVRCMATPLRRYEAKRVKAA
jgi:hypothetical protein